MSIWEVAIKAAQGRADFPASARRFRDVLLSKGFEELEISSHHALAVGDLPLIHRDPFDRLLIAQATVERIDLLTADSTIARYPGPIRKV